MMDYLDRFVLTEDQKKSITDAWVKMNNAGIPCSLDALAQVVQGENLKWVVSEDGICPTCEKTKSKKQ